MKKSVLIKSTSGIRGIVGRGLDPLLVMRYAAAFGTFLKKGKVVLGRDSRPSGAMISNAAISGLQSVGIDVVDLGIVPTPTVEIAVTGLKAAGGICVTASHNPAQWNALKFFNDSGEFITPAQYKKLNRIFESNKFSFKPFSGLGSLSHNDGMIDEHIKQTLAMKAINRRAIKKRSMKVVLDAVNSAGSFALPSLLRKLGVKVIEINCKGDGDFVHEPEPTPGNLLQLTAAVIKHKADLGLACDPDADRLALVDEYGKPIGEELTLTIAVKQVLKKSKGATVINLSTSNATADMARRMGSSLYHSRVGEANVVQMMHLKKAIIGGEGNGGVIYPPFHAGRDALVAAALVLSCLAEEKLSLSELVETLPKYYNIKSKAAFPDNFERKLKNLEKDVPKLVGKTKVDRRDGLRFDFARGWLQLRKSNTEPIYRMIVETSSPVLTQQLSQQIKDYFKN